MNTTSLLPDILPASARADLAYLLDAWKETTANLEQTHEVLQAEVRRLTDELAIKNRELARKNRLADLGQMAAHVAHEVRNSLVPVTLYLSLLRRRLASDADTRNILDKMAAGFTGLDATVNDLLHFTAERDPQRTHWAARQLVEEVLTVLAPQLSAQGIQVAVQIPEAEKVFADWDMLRRVLLNLTLNALDAMPHGGKLTITTRQDDVGWEITVADSGSGLSEDALQRAFEPFFSTKNTGTGLGLSIVYRIAEVHGGQVHIGNQPTGGAAFTFRIPLAASAANAGQRMAV